MKLSVKEGEISGVQFSQNLCILKEFDMYNICILCLSCSGSFLRYRMQVIERRNFMDIFLYKLF